MYKTINFLLEGGFLKVERKEFKREDGVETTLKVHTTTHLGHVLIMAIENVNILLDGENSVKDFNMRNK